MRTNISNKTGTPKYLRLNGKQRFIRKKDVIRSVLIQDRGRHLVNKKTSGGNNIGPENAWAHAFEILELGQFQGSVYSFS